MSACSDQWKVLRHNQEESPHQEPDCAGILISDYQPAEQWEIVQCCVRATQADENCGLVWQMEGRKEDLLVITLYLYTQPPLSVIKPVSALNLLDFSALFLNRKGRKEYYVQTP